MISPGFFFFMSLSLGLWFVFGARKLLRCIMFYTATVGERIFYCTANGLENQNSIYFSVINYLYAVRHLEMQKDFLVKCTGVEWCMTTLRKTFLSTKKNITQYTFLDIYPIFYEVWFNLLTSLCV